LILDSSAIVAVLRREEGYRRCAAALDEARELAIGAPTLFETGMVAISRFGLDGRARVAQFLERYAIVVISFDERHWHAAAEAFIRYGKGRDPAGLNYGDCMAYATAYVADRPLLFTGNDFSQTDIAAA
jgi:ribonuclease VapC